MAFGQNGTALRGIVTWTGYDCLRQATLEGRLTGSRLEARLHPLDPAEPEGSLTLTWEVAEHRLAGTWTLLSTPCSAPPAGTVILHETAFGQQGATSEPQGLRAVYLRVQTDEATTEILFRR